MNQEINVRAGLPTDAPEIERLYPEAFPDEDLVALVRALLTSKENAFSFIALVNEVVAGHIIFTQCRITGQRGHVALLGPLAVAPEMQKLGVGSTLIHKGLEHLKERGVGQVNVLGDPAYYGRFGFVQDDEIAPPYPLPTEWASAWQNLRLSDDAPVLQGQLDVPLPWQQKALWEP